MFRSMLMIWLRMILWLLVLVLIEDEAMLQSSSKGIDPPAFNFLNVHGEIDI